LVGSTASATDSQFTSITAVAKSATAIEINDATYPGGFFANGNNTSWYWSAIRTANFASTAPTAIEMVMNMTFSDISSGSNQGFAVAVGSGFSDGLTNSQPANATVNSGFTILSNSTAKVATYGTNTGISSSGITQGSKITVTFVVNNTGSTLSYTNPNGGTTTLANGKWDFWQGTTQMVTAASAVTAGVDLQNLYIGSSTGKKHSLLIDDINIYDLSPTTTPVTFTGITAQLQNNGTATVTWKVASETAIKLYEVQASQDGTNFTTVGTVAAKAINGSASYSIEGVSTVAGANFYRVKSVGENNGIGYSNIVSVLAAKASLSGVTVYPNPVTGSHINIRFNNLVSGVYSAKLLNISGQQVAAAQLNYTEGALQGIDIPAAVTSGNYKLEVSGNGNVYTTSVVVE